MAAMTRSVKIIILLTIIVTSNIFPQEDYLRIHKNAIMVDGHNDVLLRVMSGRSIDQHTSVGHSDLFRFAEGGIDVQFFSVWMGMDYGKGKAFRRANTIIDTLEAIVGRNGDKIALARSADEAEEIVRNGKLAAVIGVEGGHMIEECLDYIDSLYNRGMRYMTLTWTGVPWVSSSVEESKKDDTVIFKGLNPFGEEVVKRMNNLGIMIDVSHAGERAFWEIIAVSKKPVIASHSSVYAIAPVPRNLNNDQIRAVAAKGGVICINFYSGFIDSTYDRKSSELRRKSRPMIDSIRHAHAADHLADEIIDSIMMPQYREIQPPLSLLIDHIDYIVRLVGADFVGIGSDFDGVESVPRGLKDVTSMPLITKELLARGYSERDIDKILGGNFLRVFREVCR
jgi:membrane dipeptidase